jgi:hypothetical protein
VSENPATDRYRASIPNVSAGQHLRVARGDASCDKGVFARRHFNEYFAPSVIAPLPLVALQFALHNLEMVFFPLGMM